MNRRSLGTIVPFSLLAQGPPRYFLRKVRAFRLRHSWMPSSLTGSESAARMTPVRTGTVSGPQEGLGRD